MSVNILKGYAIASYCLIYKTLWKFSVALMQLVRHQMIAVAYSHPATEVIEQFVSAPDAAFRANIFQ